MHKKIEELLRNSHKCIEGKKMKKKTQNFKNEFKDKLIWIRNMKSLDNLSKFIKTLMKNVQPDKIKENHMKKHLNNRK